MLYCAAIYKMSLGRRHKGGNAITLSWKVKKAASPIACSLSSAPPSPAWGRGSEGRRENGDSRVRAGGLGDDAFLSRNVL